MQRSGNRYKQRINWKTENCRRIVNPKVGIYRYTQYRENRIFKDYTYIASI